MVKRIVFTGPESTGKSFLSNLISKEFDCLLIQEYAREYLSKLENEYVLSDLKKIEEGQQLAEAEAISSSSEWIVQDTDFLTLWIWYNYKYQMYPERVYHYLQDHLPCHYLLCYPDIPWDNDPLRENPFDREELFNVYQREIKKLKIPYTIIMGDYKVRMAKCMKIIKRLM